MARSSCLCNPERVMHQFQVSQQRQQRPSQCTVLYAATMQNQTSGQSCCLSELINRDAPRDARNVYDNVGKHVLPPMHMMTGHLLHVMCMLDVLLELATQSVLVVYKGMVHLQPGAAVSTYSKLKLLQHKVQMYSDRLNSLHQLLLRPQSCSVRAAEALWLGKQQKVATYF